MLVSLCIMVLKAYCLCCTGWLELCIRVTVVVGFLYILNLCMCSSLVMIRSMLLLFLYSAVKVMFLCILFMWVSKCSPVSYTHLDVYKRQLLTHINKIHKNITFTAEYEHNNTINFLDLYITKLEHRHKFSIYRKPTTTDTLIHLSLIHIYPQHFRRYTIRPWCLLVAQEASS